MAMTDSKLIGAERQTSLLDNLSAFVVRAPTAGNDTLNGNSSSNTISGLGGNDVINGKGGADDLYGGAGKDSLYGGSGKDSLYGGGGVDLLRGDGGNDALFGGTGADQFVFKNNHGNDTIEGFQNNVDKIRLEPTTNISVNINYSGGNATVTVAAMNITILVENVANNSLQLTQEGNVFFLT